jgi:hypothetical protein
MTHIEQLGNTLQIPISRDEQGYLGRECPEPECEGYFKIVPGTGLQGVDECVCPYCGHKGNQNKFFTKDQIEYAKSIAFRKITDAVVKDLKNLEFEHKPKGPFGIGLSLKVKPGQPRPIYWYREKELETQIVCSNCTLKYAVYGVFGFCPDCGQHNSLQILQNNLKLAQKMMDFAKSADTEISEKVVENALEDCISAFDGFGRELCKIHSCKSKYPDKINKISFQSLDGAKEGIKNHFEFNLDEGISNEEWRVANISFQKRHLLAHKMGIIDEEYVRRSGDTIAIIGRKIVITSEDVLNLIPTIEKLAVFLVKSMDDVRTN